MRSELCLLAFSQFKFCLAQTGRHHSFRLFACVYQSHPILLTGNVIVSRMDEKIVERTRRGIFTDGPMQGGAANLEQRNVCYALRPLRSLTSSPRSWIMKRIATPTPRLRPTTTIFLPVSTCESCSFWAICSNHMVAFWKVHSWTWSSKRETLWLSTSVGATSTPALLLVASTISLVCLSTRRL